MGTRNYRERRTPKSTYINVAPLVEVMLVLIIVFMITVPVLNVGVPVDLPKTKAASLNDSKTPPIVISIDKDSKLYIEEAEVSLDDLIRKLPLILENGKSDTVYIRGDKDLPYGAIMEIMGILSSTGTCKVSLISEAADSSTFRSSSDFRSSSEPNVSGYSSLSDATGVSNDSVGKARKAKVSKSAKRQPARAKRRGR